MSVILKKYTTEMAHIVRNAYSQRCANSIHGHSVNWEVYVEGPILESTGMVIDFKQLQSIKNFIDRFDHSTILWNDEKPEIISFFQNNFERVVTTIKNPTAENMARLVLRAANVIIASEFGDEYLVKEVRVWETVTGCGIATEYDDDDIIATEQLSD